MTVSQCEFLTREGTFFTQIHIFPEVAKCNKQISKQKRGGQGGFLPIVRRKTPRPPYGADPLPLL